MFLIDYDIAIKLLKERYFDRHTLYPTDEHSNNNEQNTLT